MSVASSPAAAEAAKAKAQAQAELDNPDAEPEVPKEQYVTLTSGDGHSFRILRECAMLSGAIRAMLASDFVEAQGVIEFKEISKKVLEKIVQYLYYARHCYLSKTPQPEFEVQPEIALELLMACNFLDV